MEKYVPIGLAISLIMAVLLSPFASTMPDGLEKVAEEKGFNDRAGTSGFTAPMQDYSVFPEKTGSLSGPLSGLVGTVATFLLGVFGARLLLKKEHRNNDV